MSDPASRAITPFTWLFFAIVLRAINQVLMKLAAMEWAAMEWAALDWAALEPLDVERADGSVLYASLGLGVAIIFVLVARAYAWQKALAELPLTVAYPFFALTILTLMGSGHLIFDEAITRPNLLGAVLICIGIYVIASSYETGDDR